MHSVDYYALFSSHCFAGVLQVEVVSCTASSTMCGREAVQEIVKVLLEASVATLFEKFVVPRVRATQGSFEVPAFVDAVRFRFLPKTFPRRGPPKCAAVPKQDPKTTQFRLLVSIATNRRKIAC